MGRNSQVKNSRQQILMHSICPLSHTYALRALQFFQDKHPYTVHDSIAKIKVQVLSQKMLEVERQRSETCLHLRLCRIGNITQNMHVVKNQRCKSNNDEQ